MSDTEGLRAMEKLRAERDEAIRERDQFKRAIRRVADMAAFLRTEAVGVSPGVQSIANKIAGEIEARIHGVQWRVIDENRPDVEPWPLAEVDPDGYLASESAEVIARYLAALSPDVALALCAEIRRLRSAKEGMDLTNTLLHGQYADARSDGLKWAAAVERLQRENDEAHAHVSRFEAEMDARHRRIVGLEAENEEDAKTRAEMLWQAVRERDEVRRERDALREAAALVAESDPELPGPRRLRLSSASAPMEAP